ncbi:TPA: pyrophosphohydrolase [Candidatus Dependentiae bacterium]|nr:pyrophosphohydrolase [Candidatus Dependentiae bacterium]HCU01023.1 pyrophosphohydrolase [Candidatus Dependentiae bacterium]
MLPAKPLLSDFHHYTKKLEVIRGFDDERLIDKCLLLGEEIGELFKAVRKHQGIKIDNNSKIGTIKEELADTFLYLLAIANRCNINLEDAFREKEEINKKRIWERQIS